MFNKFLSEHVYFAAGASAVEMGDFTCYRMANAERTGLEVVLVQRRHITDFDLDAFDVVKFPRILFDGQVGADEKFVERGFTVGTRYKYTVDLSNDEIEPEVPVARISPNKQIRDTLFNFHEVAPDGFLYARGQFHQLMLNKCSSPAFNYFVATHDGALVGAIGVIKVGGDAFRLKNLYVRPDSRGQKFSTKIVRTGLSIVQSMGGRRAEAYALAGSIANELYRNMGFELSASDKQARKIL